MKLSLMAHLLLFSRSLLWPRFERLEAGIDGVCSFDLGGIAGVENLLGGGDKDPASAPALDNGLSGGRHSLREPVSEVDSPRARKSPAKSLSAGDCLCDAARRVEPAPVDVPRIDHREERRP